MSFCCICIIIDPDCGTDIKESDNIASLHKQIAACDTILEVCTAVCPHIVVHQI